MFHPSGAVPDHWLLDFDYPLLARLGLDLDRLWRRRGLIEMIALGFWD